jgi:glycerophosphoryl diester phosphodiesterase
MSAPDWLVARPIAHRGLHDRARGIVENTLSAAEAAIAGGFAIECDVQDTADGEAVVFHDDTLDRLTDQNGPVRDRAAAQLTTVAIAGTQDRIAILQTFLDRIGGRVPVIIEIKSRFDRDMALARRTAQIASRYKGRVALKSFDPEIVILLRRLAPDLPRGIVAETSYDDREYDALSAEAKRAMANLLHFPETEPDFISWRVRDLPLAAPFLCRHLGRRPLMTWTVRTEEDRRRALDHADQMIFEGFRPDV